MNSPREHFVRKSKEGLTKIISFGKDFIAKREQALIKLEAFREKRKKSREERHAELKEAGRIWNTMRQTLKKRTQKHLKEKEGSRND